MILSGIVAAPLVHGQTASGPADEGYTAGFSPVGAGSYWALQPDGVAAIQTATAIAAQPIDWSAAAVFLLTLPSGGITLSPVFANASVGQEITIITTQGSTPSTNNWTNVGGTSLKWVGGTNSTLTASGSAVDMFIITCIAPGVYLGYGLKNLS